MSEYILSDPEVDEVDIEAMLVQVMLDEFEVAVDDGTAADVADTIMRVRTECEKGDFRGVEEMKSRWERVRGKQVVGQEVEGSEDDDESESDEDEEDDDVEMGEPAPPKEKPAPQIDEDGFETVVRRKR